MSLMTPFSRAREMSVFRNTEGISGRETWILWFHRVSFFKYFMYGSWGLTSTIELLPSVTGLGGSWVSFWFAVTCAISAYVGAVGTFFFPRTAKLELWGSIPLLAALTFYVGALSWALPSGDVRFSSWILALTYAMIPGLRAAIIYTGTGKKLIGQGA